ncbi:MAG: serine protease, partial [Verrucomicrobiota bacterium]
LAADQGYQATNMAAFIGTLTAAELAKAIELAGSFQTSKTTWGDEPSWSCKQPFACEPEICSGTGFFITDDGYLITNHHLVKNAGKVFLVTSAGTIAAEVVKVDVVTDLALLKATGQFIALPIADSRNVKLGSPVMTVGYPMPPVMGYSPKFAKGDIAALADGADNPLRFQISVPIQPGNSGGALLDECGNVVGVVNAKINVEAAFDSSGQLPENVNYAIKSQCVLSFLESVPEVKLRPINLQEKRAAEIASQAEQSSVLILVYGKESPSS